MKHISFAVLTASALMVTACGGGSSSPTTPVPTQGGGGASGNVNGSSVTNSSSATNSSSSTSTSSSSTNTQSSIQGIAYTEKEKGDFVKLDISSSDINTLVVDGKQYTLPAANLSNTIIATGGQYKSLISGAYLKHSRHGIYFDGKYAILFAHGTPTADMPSGTATYQGYSTQMTADADAYEKAGGFVGSSAFNVDFGKKTITGTVSGAGLHTVNLSGTITGNTFSNGVTDPNRMQFNGGFYGPKAAELAGVYLDNGAEVGGTFGATKK